MWEHSRAKGSALLVLIAIADMANDEGDCWPGRTSLAKKCRMGVRNLQAKTVELDQMGELEIILNDGKQTAKGKTNRYRILGVQPAASQSARGESDCTPGVNQTAPHKGEGVNPAAPLGVNQTAPDPLVDPSFKNDPFKNDPSSESILDDSNDPPALLGDDDEFDILIQAEIQKIGLDKAAHERLLEQGLMYALALRWHVAKTARTNPAGLAVSVMGKGGPPEDLLERASYAIGLKTLNDREIDRHINQDQLGALGFTADEMTARAIEWMETPQVADPKVVLVPEKPEPEVIEKPVELGELHGPWLPLDTLPVGASLTWRAIWGKALWQLGIENQRLAYRLRGPDLTVTEGVLILKFMYRTWVERHEELLRKLLEDAAQVAIQVKFEYEADQPPRPIFEGTM